ncbi:T9SS type A sorting domain-containing protein [Tenacibaculum sp. 190524A05c]|uniref:T9SS type A sorting domain-containing protein n=1 Tax=Tenacibaculum platacis TaxID=3137852 RepID=A0ABM9P3I4_9FLAO
MKSIITLILSFISAITFAQNISFTFVNARNTNDGTNDYYEADIYISSDTDFIIGSGQIYFNYNTAAFGDNVHTNGNFEMTQPDGSILATSFFGGAVAAYQSFVVNDNTTSRVSTSFQQLASSGSFAGNNVTSTAAHLFSIKFKYADINESPNVTFEEGSVFLDQFFTACGPTTSGFNTADCTNTPGSQITGDSFDSTGAVVITSATWTGAVDPDWASAGNWDINALPETTYDIIIPNVTDKPVIGIGTDAQMKDLTIDASSSLVILDMSSAQVDGDFTNNGTVTISSGETNSGSLIVKGTASGSGTVTYLRGGLLANKWYVVSSPVVGQSIKEFAENASNNIRINTTVTPNRYAIAYYDDSNADGAKWVYYTTDDLTTNTLTFEKGRGYAISRATDGQVSFTGTVETSTVTKTVVASEWNAVGNPFTAFLPLNENTGDNFVADNNASMDPAFVAAYVWDNTQNKYVANSLVTSENSLAPGQGFFIKAGSSASSIILDHSQLLTQPTTGGIFAKGTANQTPTINVIATANDVSVKTTIKYFSNTTKGLDPGYDVGNFGAANFDVFTHLLEESNEDFTIQSLPNSDYENMIIPVGLKLAGNTKVSFAVSSLGLPTELEVYIEDREEGKIVKMNDENDYAITSSSAINGVGRFYIHTISSKLSTDDIDSNLSEVNIFKSGKKEITVSGLTANATAKVYSILGEEITTSKANANSVNRINLSNVSTGIYIVKLATDFGTITKKVIVE